jgi:hypothetical protein
LTETDFTKDSAFSFEALKIIDLLKPALSIELYENLTAVMSPIYLLGRMNQIYVEVYSRVLQGICSREHFSHGFPSLIILTLLEMINRSEKDQVVLNCLSTLRFSVSSNDPLFTDLDVVGRVIASCEARLERKVEWNVELFEACVVLMSSFNLQSAELEQVLSIYIKMTERCDHNFAASAMHIVAHLSSQISLCVENLYQHYDSLARNP